VESGKVCVSDSRYVVIEIKIEGYPNRGIRKKYVTDSRFELTEMKTGKVTACLVF
jgi:hypothetical protein